VYYCLFIRTVTVVKVVGVGVIHGRIQINLGRMSWTGHEN
jgi:hypothetical protein